MYRFASGAAFGRLVFIVLWIIGSVVTLGLSGATPAHAVCVQNGANVTCTGTTPGGFGDGTDDFLFVNVVPGATLFGGNPAVTALNLRDGNMVINAGTLSSTGLGGIGLSLGRRQSCHQQWRRSSGARTGSVSSEDLSTRSSTRGRSTDDCF